jgi:hypothetical protein
MIGKVCEAFVSGMTSKPGGETTAEKNALVQALVAIIAFVLVVVILAFLGKFLWNNSIVPLLSVAKPATSAWHIIGLYVFASLMVGA